MKSSQTSQIYSCLSRGFTLTPRQALNLFGCLRLAARIRDLRKIGIPVITETVTHRGKRFARYRLPRKCKP